MKIVDRQFSPKPMKLDREQTLLCNMCDDRIWSTYLALICKSAQCAAMTAGVLPGVADRQFRHKLFELAVKLELAHG